MVKLMAVKGIPILLLSGRVDAHEVPAVRDAIASLIDRPTPALIVDLSAVTFIDSAALALLLATRKACLAGGGAMALCGMTQPVRDIFELTRLFPLFPHYERLAEAVNALAPVES